VTGGGDYVLQVKSNQPTLHDDIERFFTDSEQAGDRGALVHCHETTDDNHGRVQRRRTRACDDAGWYTDRTNWKGLRSIVTVEAHRQVGDHTSTEHRYYITSLPPDAERLGDVVRGHWSIENNLRWVLDIAFGEDDSRIHAGHSAEDIAVLRHIALNALKQEKTAKVGIKTKRKMCGWDHDYLLSVLTHA